MTSADIIRSWVVLLLLVALAGCSGTPAPQPQLRPALEPVASQPGPAGLLPPLPGADSPDSAYRLTSDSSALIQGDAATSHFGASNHLDPGAHTLVIVPGGEDELAWATYSLPNVDLNRPVNVEIQAAPIVPGGEDELLYWVLLSDYSANRWVTAPGPGPAGAYSGPASVVLNSATVRARFVSAKDGATEPKFSYAIVTRGNADNSTGKAWDAQPRITISAGETTLRDVTDVAYHSTQPHYTPLLASAAKGGSTLKHTSAMLPIVIGWQHVVDTVNSGANEAAGYEIARQGPGDVVLTPADIEPLIIGEILTPAAQYSDPDDNTLGSAPLPGQSYHYFLRGKSNSGNSSAWASDPASVFIDLQGVLANASDDNPTQIQIDWSPVNGVKGYRVFRYTDTNPAGASDISGLLLGDQTAQYIDSDAFAEILYYYWVQAVGEGPTVSDLDDLYGPLDTYDTGQLSEWLHVPVAGPQSGGTVGMHCSLATMADGHPAICYYDDDEFLAGGLKFAYSSSADGSSGWSSVTVDSANLGTYCQLALINSKPAICYFNNNNGDLKYAYSSQADGSSGWTNLTVDSGAVVAAGFSLAPVAGCPAISYANGSFDLRFARSTQANGSSGWSSVDADNSLDDVGFASSLAVVAGHPCISYRDSTNSKLKYASSTQADGSSGWTSDLVVPGVEDFGSYSSLAALPSGQGVIYRDLTGNNVVFSFCTTYDGSSGWNFSSLLMPTGSGDYCSMKLVNGVPAAAFVCSVPMYATSPTPTGSGGWSLSTIELGVSAQYTSLAVVAGLPAVAYYDVVTQSLRYAIKP